MVRASWLAFAAADAGGVVMNDDARFRVAQNAKARAMTLPVDELA